MWRTSLLVCIVVATLAKADIVPKIINGTEARAGEFPWQAAIYWSDNQARSFFCGGALVAPRWVLTGAHCAARGVYFTIYLGTVSLSATDPNRQIFQTRNAFAHPTYNATTFEDDVGLIDLGTEAQINDYVQVIQMDIRYLLTGGLVTTAGWGVTVEGSTQISETLRYMILTTITFRECQDYYSNAVNGKMICGSSMVPNQGVCAGDTGGALISFDYEGTPLHVGISTFVSDAGCGSSYPAGFTRTSYYTQWVTDVISRP